MILYDINHMRNQRPRLPAKGRSRLKNNLEVRITLAEILQHRDKQLHVIVRTSHKVSASEVYPLKLREPLTEFLLYMHKSTLEDIRATLTMTMAMKACDILRERLWKVFCKYSKASARSTRVIDISTNLRILRIYTYTEFYSRISSLCTIMVTLILRKRIKREMARHTCDVIYLIIRICRRECMCRCPKLLIRQTSL